MKNFLLNLIFPEFCIGCKKEGTYLCQDCLSLINISNTSLKIEKEIKTIYCATDYNNLIIKRLITTFKYKPFAKELSKTLAFIIIIYFQNLEKLPDFFKKKNEFLLIPIPLYKKRLKWRGFNQTEEISKILSEIFKIPLALNILVKTRQTIPQLNLPQEKRKENVKGVFACTKPELIKGKNILLIDDVITTGATIQEAAKTLKKSGAKQILGIVVAGG